MSDFANAYKLEQLETAGELLISDREGDEATGEVSVEQSLMAIQILRKLGGRSVTGFNPQMTLRREMGILRDDEDRHKLFGETFNRLRDVRLVKVHDPETGKPRNSRSAELTFLGRGAYRELFGRIAPVSQPKNR